MKKSMNNLPNHARCRRQFLSTVSAIALLGSACGLASAQAADSDADRGPVWLELGWHFENISGKPEPFAPPFTSAVAAAGFTPPQDIEKKLPWSYGADGKISFLPEGTDWVFSASIRYGRAHGSKSLHEQTKAQPVTLHFLGITYAFTPRGEKFSETNVSNTETHAVVDFQVGKDVGLGFLAHGAASTLSGGVRFAQFHSESHSRLHADPDYNLPTSFVFWHFHNYAASDDETRGFHGLGPSISWNATLPLAGSPQDGGISLDWGVNFAFLFGRQKASGTHQSSSLYSKRRLVFPKYERLDQGPEIPHDRSKSVTVPNVGGFAGLSLQWADAKISLGYRADLFFGAIDGGIDTHNSINQGFTGPYASISVGMGD